jgi:hypothetical protein
MDAYEATKVVLSRIQALDHAAKIMGLLLIQDHGEKEMIRLAFGPESLLHVVMDKARKDLGLLLPDSPTTVAAAGNAPPFLQLPRQSSGCVALSLLSSVSSPSSWAQAPAFSRSSNNGSNGAHAEDGEELPSPGNGGAAPFFPQAARDAMLEDMQLQEQLEFLNDNPALQFAALDGGECPRPDPGDGFPYGLGGAGGGDGFGWKPCLYYARGFCKNGSSCRFVHAGHPDAAADQQQQPQCQDFLLRSKCQRFGPAAAFPYSPTSPLPGSPSAAGECLSLLLLQQQQQHDR